MLDALARIRRATANRPQGPARVAPNHVFVGEAASAINFHGEPRLQGGPGSTVRPAALPAALPQRTSRPDDGRGVRIAVLDTGMFEHEWLKGVQRAPGSEDVWDVDRDGYGDAEAGHGTFIAGLILQAAPAASVYAVKVLDSHGVGDDLSVAAAIEQLPHDIDIVNLSLGGYTDRDTAPLALSAALQAVGEKRGVVVAAAGNQGASRPFWPAAFEPVLAVGAVEQREGKWTRAGYSNHGPWVDATARGTNLQSTFTREKTKLATGLTISPTDPTIAFDGWASWDGTSFATPIAAAMLARTMSRKGLTAAAEAQAPAARILAAGSAARLPARRAARRARGDARPRVAVDGSDCDAQPRCLPQTVVHLLERVDHPVERRSATPIPKQQQHGRRPEVQHAVARLLEFGPAMSWTSHASASSRSLASKANSVRTRSSSSPSSRVRSNAPTGSELCPERRSRAP